MEIYRQGDVLLIPVSAVPDGVNKVRRDRKRGIVLAEGEATGHAHKILDRGASLYELIAPGDVEEMRRRFLHVESEVVALVHDEHATIHVPSGDYEVIGQVEYQPEALRRVAD